MKKIILFLSLCVVLPLFPQTRSLDSLQAILPSLEGKARLEVLYKLSNDMESVFPGRAKEYGLEGLNIARELYDSSSAATLLSSLAFSSSELGNFSEALSFAYHSLEISEAIGDKKRIASAHSTLGITYVYLGQYSKALSHHLIALRLREELGLNDRAANTMNNIGIAYHNIGQYDKAIMYYKRGMEKLGPALNDIVRARYYTNIGFAEFKRGNIDSARYYYHEAERLSARSPLNGVQAYLYFNLGTLNGEIKEYAAAVKYLESALQRYSMLGQKFGMVQLYNALARTYVQTKQYKSALVYLDSAVALARLITAPEQLKESYEIYYHIYKVTGPLQREYQYFQLYSVAKDSLMNYNESKKIAEALFSHEIAEQQRQIELLKRERTIADLNAEKDELWSKLLFGGMVFAFIAVLFLFSVNHRMKKSHATIEQKNIQMEQLNKDLQEKIGEVNMLTGFLPICSNCKKIRDD
ncbi:MAG: tetratricopeptide repeat protein, partial [Bacteroidota bacterium]